MPKVVIFGMNEVAVAWNGPRLWENGGTGSRKGFRLLRGLWEVIKKMTGTVEKLTHSQMYYFLIFPYQHLLHRFGPLTPITMCLAPHSYQLW